MSTKPMRGRYRLKGVRGYLKTGASHEHLPATPSPCCGMLVEVSTEVYGAAGGPGEGAWTVCYRCGAVLRYQRVLGRLELRMTTRDERDAAPEEARTELRRLQAELRAKA